MIEFIDGVVMRTQPPPFQTPPNQGSME